MTSIQGIGMDEAVDCTDGRSWIFSIVGVEIVCCGVADGISKCSKHTPVCVTPPTHISVPCVIYITYGISVAIGGLGLVTATLGCISGIFVDVLIVIGYQFPVPYRNGSLLSPVLLCREFGFAMYQIRSMLQCQTTFRRPMPSILFRLSLVSSRRK